MLFSSAVFLFIFLPLVLLGYRVLRGAWRNYFLLIVSLVFYAWGEPKFVVIMLGSILLNYLSAILIGATNGKWLPKAALLGNIVITLGALFYFKYFNFFATNINDLLSFLGSQKQIANLNVIMPIGISFFTFQGMSYVVDVYRKKSVCPKKHF